VRATDRRGQRQRDAIAVRDVILERLARELDHLRAERLVIDGIRELDVDVR